MGKKDKSKRKERKAEKAEKTDKEEKDEEQPKYFEMANDTSTGGNDMLAKGEVV